MEIILLSHGALSAGMADACKMIYGSSSRFHTLSLDENDGINKFEKDLKELLESITDPYMILCDLYFGTPFNASLQLVHEDVLSGRCQVITGANLPMLLEVLNETDDISGGTEEELSALAAIALEAGKSGIYLYHPDTTNSFDDTDEEL